jgi:hypothetical protein
MDAAPVKRVILKYIHIGGLTLLSGGGQIRSVHNIVITYSQIKDSILYALESDGF